MFQLKSSQLNWTVNKLGEQTDLFGDRHFGWDIEVVSVSFVELAVERLWVDRVGDDGALDLALRLVHAGTHVRHDVLVTDVHQRFDVTLNDQ